jgi:hypothetical protein
MHSELRRACKAPIVPALSAAVTTGTVHPVRGRTNTIPRPTIRAGGSRTCQPAARSSSSSDDALEGGKRAVPTFSYRSGYRSRSAGPQSSPTKPTTSRQLERVRSTPTLRIQRNKRPVQRILSPLSFGLQRFAVQRALRPSTPHRNDSTFSCGGSPGHRTINDAYPAVRKAAKSRGTCARTGPESRWRISHNDHGGMVRPASGLGDVPLPGLSH